MNQQMASVLTRPSLSTPAICPVAIRILSGWIAKLTERDDVTTEQPIGEQQVVCVWVCVLTT